MKTGNRTFINRMISVIPVVILMAMIAVFYDHYFDLNDDVLMKDILSGTYSGTPSAHNMQMLWPISAIVALLYRTFPHVAWYGLMLIGFQYASLYIIANGIVKIVTEGKNDQDSRVATDRTAADRQIGTVTDFGISAGITLLLSALMLMHLIFVQYTITVAMMSSAAAVSFFAADKTDEDKGFLKNRLLAIIILVLAFMLRTEMTLLMLPFFGAAFVYKFSFEEKPFEKTTIKKYGYFILLLLILMFLSWMVDRIAYGTPGWKAFRNMFDSRTVLYDYEVPPSYEGNEAFYDGIGLKPEEAYLFENYNFGVDPKIDDKVMNSVAAYAREIDRNSNDSASKLKDKLKIYVYEVTHLNNAPGTDHPWNTVALILYVSAGILTVFTGKIWELWRVIALFAGRSAIWLYMLMGGRTPDRITHSLYFVEIVVLMILLSALIREADGLQREDDRKNRSIKTVITATAVGLLCAGICILVPGVRYASYEAAYRKDVNAPYIELYEYMADNTDTMYLIDTYSSVSYSEKMFDDIAFVSKANSNVFGGWAATSPLEVTKLEAYGIKDMGSGLLNDNVVFCKRTDSDDGWLKDYYASNGTDIKMDKEATIADTFDLIRITKMEK
ncbi:MAG: hypothetical protein K5870_03305 [Lachnospiraceae bacterium]|nr:hypothetical protein [Lachnospiraceae bacterium]